MAMTKQLWSLNSLATELGRDRRTIARALADVPEDGKITGHKAWFLTSAMRALGRDDAAAWAVVRGGDGGGDGGGGLLDVIRDRLASWQTIYADGPAEHLPFELAAEVLDVPLNTLLTWLRAGCPYGTPGDWKTGKGFALHLAWVAEWRAVVSGVVARAGDEDLARQLGIAV